MTGPTDDPRHTRRRPRILDRATNEEARPTPIASATVTRYVPRSAQVNLEGRAVDSHPPEVNDPQEAGRIRVYEVAVSAVHLHPDTRLDGYHDRIDPDRGLGGELHPSRLATVDEERHR